MLTMPAYTMIPSTPVYSNSFIKFGTFFMNRVARVGMATERTVFTQLTLTPTNTRTLQQNPAVFAN